jgi:hypothetical protein
MRLRSCDLAAAAPSLLALRPACTHQQRLRCATQSQRYTQNGEWRRRRAAQAGRGSSRLMRLTAASALPPLLVLAGAALLPLPLSAPAAALPVLVAMTVSVSLPLPVSVAAVPVPLLAVAPHPVLADVSHLSSFAATNGLCTIQTTRHFISTATSKYRY